MKFANANELEKKSGESPTIAFAFPRTGRCGARRKAMETNHYRPTYAHANAGHPSSPVSSPVSCSASHAPLIASLMCY